MPKFHLAMTALLLTALAGPAAAADPKSVAEFTAKRVRFDEDLWLIELDVPLPERFIAETIATG